MKKYYLLLITTIITINCYSQINFEKGYYINDSGEKIECLIKNIDWKNNPNEIEIKNTLDSEVKKIELKNLEEFSVYNNSKFIKRDVKIDISTDNINKLDHNNLPIFEDKTVLLKVLIEGNANLYYYEDGNLRRFFYSTNNENIEQLIFKRYLTSGKNVKSNIQFKQQLRNNLKCKEINLQKIEYLDYSKKSLLNFFKVYNNCTNSDFTDFSKNKKIDLFNLSLKPRINSSSLAIKNSLSENRDNEFDNELGFSFSLEAEMIMPFNKNKWSVFIEPSYESYKSENTKDVDNVSGGKLITKVDYSSIEIPIGFRHYIFLNNQDKIFINFSYNLTFDTDSSIEFKRADNSQLDLLEIEPENNFGVGIGYKLKDKYSIEFRYNSPKEILGNYAYWNSDLKTISFILGYTVF